MSDTKFNLYHTNRSSIMNIVGHDCLYYVRERSIADFNSLTPFCLRPLTIESSDDDEKLCYGKRLTFEQLKTNNVTINDLFQWNAVIEIIDLYQKYLRFPHLVNDSELYCKCSLLSRFGKFCQYDIEIEDGQKNYRFTDFVSYSRFVRRNNDLIFDAATCFIGLQCQTNLVCLDWRQICNGIVDCDHGEDEPEELCLQMESNQCHPEKEFRCQNGHCIPISIALSTTTGFCLDRSDRINTVCESSEECLAQICLHEEPLICDEINHGWKKFSCNNGQYISFEDLTSRLSKIGQTCSNDYHLVYLREIFSTNDRDECWETLICLIGFDYLYSDLICSKGDIQFNIEKYCPTEFFFPNNSVVYSFVFFFYDQLTDRLNYSGPNYICYRKEYCPNDIFHSSTISKANLTCFSINERSFSWKNFYEEIIELFRPCFSSLISINNELLFKCHLSHSLISISRVKDKKKDCFYNEDEDSMINVCLLNRNDIFHCLSNRNECIRQSLIGDNQYDCIDGSDEYFHTGHYENMDLLRKFRPSNQRTLPEIYPFEELCDRVVNRHLFSQQSTETDETDCEYWPYSCYSKYTKCNQIWNCPNGHDEVNCENQYNDHIRKVFHCKSDEHYCIQLSNNNDVNGNCINLNRTGDGKMDCIGGTDEQFDSICVEKYPMDFQKRFHCLNSSLCIRIDQICDGISDCPFEDDELVCSSLFQNNSSTFHCRNSPEHPVIQCDKYSPNNQYCQLKEHLWFCDLRPEPRNMKESFGMDFEEYPPIDPNIQLVSYQRSNLHQQLIIPEKLQISLLNNNLHLSLCKLGYLIKSLSTNHSYCFCPPSYYGTFCQYQSEHLTILLGIQTRYLMNVLTVFRLMISLLNENQVIQSYDEIVFTYDEVRGESMYLIDLILERMTNLSLYQRTKSKYVRIDSYIIKNISVQYISSWLFDISFPFLPVNRFATVLSLVNESFTVMYCGKRCGSHGKCMHYINWKEKEYCWCNQGWFGEYCHLRSSSNLCQSTSCSPHSHCIIVNEEKKQTKCLCPLEKSGDQCYITRDPCFSHPCLDIQICVPLDDRNLGYKCKCKEGLSGPTCSVSSKLVTISIESNRTDFSLIPVIIFIFGNSHGNFFKQDTRFFYTDVTLPTILQMPAGFHQFGFVRMFYNFSKNSYYLISLHRKITGRFMNTSVKSENLCENVSDLFNKTVLNEYSYLKRLKLYHLPCQQNHNLRCFFDEYRMCICTRMHHSDCYLFSHQYGTCDYCENNGLCLTQRPNVDQWRYRCLCADCSFGSFCQFATGNYFVTLDMLIGIDMKAANSSFNEQPTVVHLTLAFLLCLLLISVIFNTPSIFVFSKKKSRQVGCDWYLFYLTVVSEIGLILLFLRFLYMLIIQMYMIENILFLRIGCKSLEYLIRLIPSVFDWLTVCISIERAYTVIKDVQFTKIVALKTLKMARWIIFGVFLINILTTLHRPFHLKLVDETTLNDEPRGHPWCVLDFGSTSWNIYEKVINICHLILPFILNLLSVLSFILNRVNFELTSAIKKCKDDRFTVIKQQIFKYKSLIIGPIVILTLEIPRFVLTFTLACIKYPWQRYVHLISYFISFLPLTAILFIYILPSPKYKQQLSVFVKRRLGAVA